MSSELRSEWAGRKWGRALRWVAVGGVSVACASIERPETVRVEGDGMFAMAQHQSGCEGAVFREEQQQFGGSVAVVHSGATGGNVGARLRVLAGRVSNASSDAGREGAVDPIVALGAYGGWELRHLGGELGFSVVYIGGEDVLPMPYLGVKAGLLSTGWGEAALGTRDPLFDGNLASIGAGYRSGAFGVRAGVSLLGRFVAFSSDGGREPDQVVFSDGVDGSGYHAYAEASYEGDEGWGVVVGGVIGEMPSARLGLSWAWGVDWAGE